MTGTEICPKCGTHFDGVWWRNAVTENERLRAELDAEREEATKWHDAFEQAVAERDLAKQQLAARQHDITECVATLAAERKKALADNPLFRKAIESNLEATGIASTQAVEIQQLREQLAAERKRADNAEARYASLHTMESDALRERLAAAVDALKEVNALARGNMTGCGTCNHVIDATIAALAKIGG